MDRIQRVNDAIKWIFFEGLAKNQTDLAQKLGYTKSSFSQIVNGRVNISDNFIENLTKFALSLSKHWLLTGEGSMLLTSHTSPAIQELTGDTPTQELYNFEATNITKDTVPEIMYNNHGNKFTFYPDGRIYIEVLKIPSSAHASYITCYHDDAQLIQEFDTVQFRVDKFGLGHYKAFDVVGDSMNGGNIEDTPDGAEVLGREVGRHLWEGGFRNTTYGFIVITKDATFLKDITNYDEKKGVITLSSRNKIYEPFEYPINSVYQIFHVIKRIF